MGKDYSLYEFSRTRRWQNPKWKPFGEVALAFIRMVKEEYEAAKGDDGNVDTKSLGEKLRKVAKNCSAKAMKKNENYTLVFSVESLEDLDVEFPVIESVVWLIKRLEGGKFESEPEETLYLPIVIS